jgi:hypothetical protein
MADSRADLIRKIDSQRAVIREHIAKYKKFKANGDYTSSATSTISNCQSIIRDLRAKDRSIDTSDEDTWQPN